MSMRVLLDESVPRPVTAILAVGHEVQTVHIADGLEW